MCCCIAACAGAYGPSGQQDIHPVGEIRLVGRGLEETEQAGSSRGHSAHFSCGLLMIKSFTKVS